MNYEPILSRLRSMFSIFSQPTILEELEYEFQVQMRKLIIAQMHLRTAKQEVATTQSKLNYLVASIDSYKSKL